MDIVSIYSPIRGITTPRLVKLWPTFVTGSLVSRINREAWWQLGKNLTCLRMIQNAASSWIKKVENVPTRGSTLQPSSYLAERWCFLDLGSVAAARLGCSEMRRNWLRLRRTTEKGNRRGAQMLSITVNSRRTSAVPYLGNKQDCHSRIISVRGKKAASQAGLMSGDVHNPGFSVAVDQLNMLPATVRLPKDGTAVFSGREIESL